MNWPADQQAITTSDLPNSFVKKFVHGILPTGKVIHQYKWYYDHWCPSCHQEQEDRWHLLRCQHQDRVKWSSPMLQDLWGFCTLMKVSGEMTQHLLVEHLLVSSWLTFRKHLSVPTTSPPTHTFTGKNCMGPVLSRKTLFLVAGAAPTSSCQSRVCTHTN